MSTGVGGLIGFIAFLIFMVILSVMAVVVIVLVLRAGDSSKAEDESQDRQREAYERNLERGEE